MDEILKVFDEKKATIIIFLDLSAAFDTTDFDEILELLSKDIPDQPSIPGRHRPSKSNSIIRQKDYRR